MDTKTIWKWLRKAGIPPDAIGKIMAYAATQEKLKKSVKFNDKTKLDTSQIEDMRNVHTSKKTPTPASRPVAKEWWK